ncbi:hypothetical protein WJM97_09285 [Okeanomitos corallinicola TIOX110]|uniref:Uncharacterized protein n=1 Tax=Okeanomitos corallinicola TIOX110 TaxID=3133117 RepID=A0ABZ2UX14_9CYAN
MSESGCPGFEDLQDVIVIWKFNQNKSRLKPTLALRQGIYSLVMDIPKTEKPRGIFISSRKTL